MTERVDSGGNQGSAASNAQFEMNDQFIATSGTVTGPKDATAVTSGVGATKTITLKPPSTARTCPIGVAIKKQTPIWLRSVSTNAVDTGTSIVMDKPAGAQENDVLVLVIAAGGGGGITAPSGFTNFNWTSGIFAYWHVVGASDPGPWTWSLSGASGIVGWMGAYVGVDVTNVADPTHPTATSSGTSHSTSTSSPMSTANQYELVMAVYRVYANTTLTPPSDMLEVADFMNPAATVALEVNHALQPLAGPSGVKTATSSASGSGANVIFAMNPIAANTTELASTTVSISSPNGPTLVSTGSLALTSTTFASGDHLILDVSVPDDPNNCPAVRVSYDSTGRPSKLTIASIVPEGVAGLLVVAPALPFAARWWKRRQP
jgi:hypothetical protein